MISTIFISLLTCIHTRYSTSVTGTIHPHKMTKDLHLKSLLFAEKNSYNVRLVINIECYIKPKDNTQNYYFNSFTHGGRIWSLADKEKGCLRRKW